MKKTLIAFSLAAGLVVTGSAMAAGLSTPDVAAVLAASSHKSAPSIPSQIGISLVGVSMLVTDGVLANEAAPANKYYVCMGDGKHGDFWYPSSAATPLEPKVKPSAEVSAVPGCSASTKLMGSDGTPISLPQTTSSAVVTYVLFGPAQSYVKAAQSSKSAVQLQ
ncbi:MAG: hypothetical protein V4496_03285 [Pseudomonadota bacterium]